MAQKHTSRPPGGSGARVAIRARPRGRKGRRLISWDGSGEPCADASRRQSFKYSIPRGRACARFAFIRPAARGPENRGGRTAPAGQGEVRIRHHAIGVNFLDTYHRTGFYPMPLPLTPAGGRGEVLEVGAASRTSRPATGSLTQDRPGYAEERNIGAQFLVKLPRAIDYDIAAAMMLKG